MNTRKVFDILDRDIRLNYNSKAEFARKVEIPKQSLNTFLKCLELSKERNIFNRTCKILEKAGYEIKIIRKKSY